MKKLLLILFLTLIALLATSYTSYASVKSPKDGVNQAGGCRTQTKNYHYTLSDPKYKGKIVFGSAKVGVCVNEHYSPFYGNYVIQTDAYISETGAFARCSGANNINGAIWINKIGQWSSLSHQDVSCPLHSWFNTYNSGRIVQRVDAKDSSDNTVGSRYFGYIRVLLLAPDNSIEKQSTLATFEFAGPSLTMK